LARDAGALGLPCCEQNFDFLAGIFYDVVHVDVDFGDTEWVFVGLGDAFYAISVAIISKATSEVRLTTAFGMETHRVKATNATRGTAHQSISEAIANGRIPQNSAKVCLWWML
jgi:hypothetical protein